jgi:gluconolactonase
MRNFGIALLVSFCVVAFGGEFEIADQAAFDEIVPKEAKVEKLAGDMKFLEGPVWVPADGGYLIFSDIPSNQLKKWTAKDGVTTFRDPSNNTNGNFLTREGQLVSCEHTGRRVSITQKDGKVETLVDSFEGKKLNSPNDLAIDAAGVIYFTDPPYGLPKDQQKEQEKNRVYRFDPKSKQLTSAADDFDMPNGICFSPDEKKVYIADSGKPRHVRVFDVNADGTLANGKVFCKIDKGAPDGIRCDAAGRFYSSADHSIQVFATDGKLIGKILCPETPANLCFGGVDRKTLFITAQKSLYSIKLNVAGAQKP